MATTLSSQKVFLLGGYDLEMLTIKQMLEERGDSVVIDKHLRWDNAKLSKYQLVLKSYPEHTIYGIELQEDITSPANYIRIDHHNDWADRPSALEQVAEVLGVSLNRDQLLVAANDKGYIPAMQQLSATEEEIADIRKRDRQAQGIGIGDEILAEKSISNNLERHGSLTIVKSLISRFSPICDRLFPYKRLLIYTDKEWMYYGEGKGSLVRHFSYEITQKKVFYGGGNNGYIGSVRLAFRKEEIKQIVDYIIQEYGKTMTTYSYHNFMFPFQWRIDGYDDEVFSEQISLNNIEYTVGSNWERSQEPADKGEADALYNERNYFYEFVHDALYDNGNSNSLIRHFERQETKHGNVTYIVNCGEKVYELKVNAINLNLYSTGVGVLSFYLYNENCPEPRDVLNINQFGRRVFPPFIGDVTKRELIAHSIEIKGLHGVETGYCEDFKRYTNKKEFGNKPASFIVDMIHEVAANIDLKPVIDDRMYVQCWYKNDKWADWFSGKKYNSFLYSNHWYEFVFVDKFDGMTCQNDAMQKKLIKNATYERWQKWCSLYGISRYSMVYLTNTGAEKFAPYLFDYFETMYARMAELILVQKASVLRFSAEVTNLSNMEEKRSFSRKVSSLYKEYIRFVNQIHFREISAQDQGIEMYQKLYETMNIEKHVEKLDAEIGELYNYVSLKEDHKSSNTMALLTWIATISVPMTVMAGIFGMNNNLLGQSPDIWINHSSVQIAFVLGMTVLFIIGIFIIKKWRLK